MNTKIRGDRRIQHIGWPTGIVGGLLLVSFGLELLARQVFGQTDVATLLWALYVGFWTFVLGTTGFLLLATQWVIEWRHLRAGPAAMNQLFSVESKSSRFEKPELEAVFPIRQQSMTSVIHGRSSLEGHDRNEVGDRTKVA
ncbi:MAG: hypothetical protein H8K07_11425 [Nitrospira sp.]|jgi:hypothetical protein|nr:hypothetical protein [Nitrospira sp.]MDI3464031.1 hypothetical protein [Nitrospira sp.]